MGSNMFTPAERKSIFDDKFVNDFATDGRRYVVAVEEAPWFLHSMLCRRGCTMAATTAWMSDLLYI
jgi:hypothetical protein